MLPVSPPAFSASFPVCCAEVIIYRRHGSSSAFICLDILCAAAGISHMPSRCPMHTAQQLCKFYAVQRDIRQSPEKRVHRNAARFRQSLDLLAVTPVATQPAENLSAAANNAHPTVSYGSAGHTAETAPCLSILAVVHCRECETFLRHPGRTTAVFPHRRISSHCTFEMSDRIFPDTCQAGRNRW